MLKIHVAFESGLHHWFASFIDHKDEFIDFGVEFVEDEEAEIVFCDVTYFHNNYAARTEKRKYVLFEWSDHAGVEPAPRHRAVLERPEVLLWLKQLSFRDANMHNAPYYGSRYHFNLLGDALNLPTTWRPQVRPISEAGLRKIHPLIPTVSSKRFEHLRRYLEAPTDFNERNIDVAFMGNLNFPRDPSVTAHRVAGAQAVSSLYSRSFVVAANPFNHETRRVGDVFGRDFFYSTLRRTKIFVSACGRGEFSFKDYESLYLGCILVRPDMGFVEGYGPDVYSHPAVVYCKHDFSDLPQIIDDIINNGDLYLSRTNELREMIAQFTPRRLAKDFSRLLNSML